MTDKRKRRKKKTEENQKKGNEKEKGRKSQQNERRKKGKKDKNMQTYERKFNTLIVCSIRSNRSLKVKKLAQKSVFPRFIVTPLM